MRNESLRRLVLLFVLVSLAGCAAMRDQPPVDYAAIIAAPDRTPEDRKNDERRKAQQLLAFTGVRPGMKVLDVATGGGYSTELMARSVGPSGVVYGQDAPSTVAGARAAYEVRAKSPAMRNVVRLMRSFDDPVPAEVGGFDLITFFFEYHEMPKAGIDLAKMNRRLFEILKPGGVLVIADHSALPGTGGEMGPTLHRIEESFVRRHVEAAGFRLIEEGLFLRSPADKRDVTVFRNTVPNDEFVLKFQRPR
jgi:predicted methyltransferase